MIRKGLLTIFLGTSAWAVEANFNPRYDLIGGRETEINRANIQADLSAQSRQFKFYADAFAEYDMASEKQRSWRRGKNSAYLQEAYGEFSTGTVFIKLGRQATRWSESWITPSLDIWTARRYERLFIDPLPQQLVHSTGAVFSFVKPSWSFDFALMSEVSQDSYPEPFPEKQDVTDKEFLNPGGRFKFEFNGFQSSLVAARALRKNTLGLATNYAFETFVPKMEIGTTYNDQKDELILNRRMDFGSLGLDIFWDDLTLLPQLTIVRNEDPYQITTPQIISYISAVYAKGRHEFQFQGFSNSIYRNSFWGALYTFTIKQTWALSALVQNYRGLGLNLASIVEEQTGGTLFGLRLQYNGSILGRK